MHVLRRWVWLSLLSVLLFGCSTVPQPTVAPAVKAPPEAVQKADTGVAPVTGAGSAPLVLEDTTCLSQAPKAPADAVRVTVKRAVDGDTVELADSTRVRLIGMNTPESVDPRRPVEAYGKEASRFTQELLGGKEILLAPGRQPIDRYGRTLAWLWLPDGRFVNGLLVAEGYAQVATYADNPDHADLLRACEREARAANRGLWALSGTETEEEAAPTTTGQVAVEGLAITRAPGTVRADGTATVTAATAPGASCSITVTYKSGPSKAQGLEPKTADAGGSVSWSWKVGSSTAAGAWPVQIRCGDQKVETTLTVQR